MNIFKKDKPEKSKKNQKTIKVRQNKKMEKI